MTDTINLIESEIARLKLSVILDSPVEGRRGLVEWLPQQMDSLSPVRVPPDWNVRYFIDGR